MAYGERGALRPVESLSGWELVLPRVRPSRGNLAARWPYSSMRCVKGGPKLDQSGGGKLDHPAARWRV